MAEVLERAPDLDIDPYDDAFIADPYPGYAAMRNAGAVFYMPKYACWGMARYKEVRSALLDWKTYCSGMGVGYTHFGKEKPWRPPSLLLETDPPVHDRPRRIVDRVVFPPDLQRLREPFAKEASAAVERVLARGRFDAVKELAEAFPLKVFPDAVGLDAEGRENLLPYGDMVFNGFGPLNARFQASTAPASTVVPWIMEKCSRAALAPDGLGAQIYQAVEAGEATEEEAALLVRSFLSAGLDTTVAAIGSALYLLATNPGEWRKLRADPPSPRTSSRKRFGWNRRSKTSSARRRARSSSTACAFQQTKRYCCCSPRPTAIPNIGRNRTASTSRAGCRATSALASAFTSASAR